MRYGQGYGCNWGNPDTFIIILSVTDLRDGIAVKFIVIAGYSQYFQMVVDGRLIGQPVYVRAGVTTTFTGSYQSRQGPHLYSIEAMGPYSRNNVFDVTQGQILFSKPRPDRLHLEIVAQPEQFSIDGET